MSSFVDISIKEEESVLFEDTPLTQQSRHWTNSSSSSSDESSTSSTIINGKYVIDKVIGRGAFGTVNLATDVKNPNIQYAIKYVHCIDHNAINSAMNEVWSLRNLQHDNLVKFETVFVHSGMNSLSGMEDLFVCFVMPFYELGDVDVYIRKRQTEQQFFTEDELSSLMLQIASAVNYLHTNNLIHRDLKPSNIFMSKEFMNIHIGDFGLIKTMEDTGLCKTVAGTLKYMAPEVLGKNMYSYSADVWSMGCIFLELSQLKLEKNMYMEVFMNPSYSEDVRTLVTTRGYSTKLADLICSMLSREESARPSAAQVLEIISSMKPEPVSSIQKSAEELIAEVVDVYVGEEAQKTYDNRLKGYIKLETLLKLPIVASILNETKSTDGRTVVTNALTKYSKMVEFNQDKTAVRRSKLVQKLHKAVAKYFSDERYYRDKFLLSIASHNNGCIPLTVFMSLKSISKVVLRHTGVTAERVASIVSDCPEIEVTDDMMVKKIGSETNNTQDRWEEARFAKKVDSAFNSQWYDKHFSNTGVGVDNLVHHPRVAKYLNRNNRFDVVQAIRRNCLNVEVVERGGNTILFRKDGVNRNRQTVSSTNDRFQFGVSKCTTTELTVMSLNILCDQSLESISAPFLKWANRARNMIAIIDSYKPHIICLQEVQSPNENKQRFGHRLFNGGIRDDHFNHMSKFLARYGYVGLYKHNMEHESPSTARIGCAVFVIKEDIDIVSISNVDLSLAKLNPGVRHSIPSQGNVAQVLHVKRKDQHILVCNTQLCAGDEHHQVLQMQACLSGVRHHLQSCPQNTPVVLAGDLRITPDSEVYRMICDDQNLGMKSCYKAVLGHEPLTCFKNGACFVSDYIFCSKAVGIGAVLDLPNADQLRSSIQGKEFSSTHAPILVKLQVQQ